MTRVILRIPGAQDRILSIHPGHALLIGRDPSPEAELVRLLGRDVELVRVDSALVSKNHVLLWSDGDRIVVKDLESRNDTLLQLPTLAPVTLPSDRSITLALAPPKLSSPFVVRSPPREVQWTGEEAYAAALAAEITRWLKDDRGLSGTVIARQKRDGSAHGAGRAIPIADGWELYLEEKRQATGVAPETESITWLETMEALWHYIHEQDARTRRERAEQHDPAFIMASATFRAAHRKVVDAADRGLRLILLGESGVGKGMLARCYAAHSPRAHRFYELNCALIERTFLHTTIFGAKKGAYTGCDTDKPGAVESADGGVLFLDEISTLAADMQSALLKFLDEGKYQRLGDSSTRTSDVRIVCGTNTDLRKAVREGTFRDDLWYRLAGAVVEIPPLRERREDIHAALGRRALSEASGSPVALDVLSVEARHFVVYSYGWPGNFRELDAFVRRLPPNGGRGIVDLPTCKALLGEGAVAPIAGGVVSGAEPDGWVELVEVASRIHGGARRRDGPATFPELQEFIEDVLKPIFVARRLGLEHITALPTNPKPSFSEMAARLGCTDDTVKNQLRRFLALRSRYIVAKTR